MYFCNIFGLECSLLILNTIRREYLTAVIGTAQLGDTEEEAVVSSGFLRPVNTNGGITYHHDNNDDN